MKLIDLFQKTKDRLINDLPKQELTLGEIIYNNGNCQILSQSGKCIELIISENLSDKTKECKLEFDGEDTLRSMIDGVYTGWDRYSYACLFQVIDELLLLDPKDHAEHKKYSRNGMMKRVLKERMEKALKADYRIQWASNIHGDHILTNEKGIKYTVFLRDFENETGYSDSMDAKLNKLGTTKHIMYAFASLKENIKLFEKLDKTYPFIEIFCNPANDYRITWHYPHPVPEEEQLLLSRFFKKKMYVDDTEVRSFLGFIREAENFENIVIRPEVKERVERAFENDMLQHLSETYRPDYKQVKASLFNYQKEGVEFALFRKAAIIADEMGLGKTLQAITTAILKKQLFGFQKTLIVCPASIKGQWKSEIEKFSDEKAVIVEGLPAERENIYRNNDCFFFIVNYESVLRDSLVINKAGIDFLILDEAQKVKNYETQRASSVKRINPRQILAITGTPIENRLIDIFSIMSIIDPYFFGPLWEFSYQYCLFDPEKPNKINGYYNLQQLNKKLEKVLIRREKRKVIEQLPMVSQINIPVDLSRLQAEYHASYSTAIAKIISKKFLTPYDLQRLQLLLTSMRMVCDSTYLIDETTNESPKLEELKIILLEKLDISNRDLKIIIFSEWIKVHKLIGRILRENQVGFVELNGKIPVKLRGELIRKFETNPQYKVFLSTEAGGVGLNLQVADTLINFELPWNPAKKNQRIGRIDRLGQKSNKLLIYNFITRDSIEQQIATGLLVKQNLFDGVLDSSSAIDFVDFSSKGRSQFIDQLESFVAKMESQDHLIEEGEMQNSVQTEMRFEETEEIQELDLSGDAEENEQVSANEPETGKISNAKTEDLEQVMNNGMQFLAGLFKMSTGKEMGTENQKIEINKETGEVILRFKLPVN